MTGRAVGRSLELYFIDGRPDGMQTAEVFNWTGHVLMTPRTRIAEALGRDEAKYTGAYLLLGENENGPLAYIGEAESLAERIRNHDQKKDWWDRAVLVTTGANNLNKAHVRYLEARLIEFARKAGRTPLENGNQPGTPGLNEAARANMESFLDYLLMVLPALRIDMFVDNAKPLMASSGTLTEPTQPRFELISNKLGLVARATLIDGEFVVSKGSEARAEWASQAVGAQSYVSLRKELEKSGVLQPVGSKRVFTVDYAFNSPSAAAAIVYGRSSNGTLAWRTADGSQTYKEWEAQQLGADGP